MDFGIYSYPDEVVGYWFALIDALEIRIVPNEADSDTEPYPVYFSWNMVSFSSRQMQIQLDIKNPEKIA